MVSELAVKVIRQFHSSIPSGSASHPSSHCSGFGAAKHHEGNRGVILTLLEDGFAHWTVFLNALRALKLPFSLAWEP